MNVTQPAAGINPGARRTDRYPVEEAHSASRVGSGSVPVLATPWLVAFMERTAHRLVAESLPAELYQCRCPDGYPPSGSHPPRRGGHCDG